MTTKEYKNFLKREIVKCSIRALATGDATKKAEIRTQRAKLEARLMAVSKVAPGRMEDAARKH